MIGTTTSTEISAATTGDPSTAYVGTTTAAIVSFQECSDWQCFLFGSVEGWGVVYRPRKGQEPNWFWRKMQYLAFGCRWVKVPKES